MKLIICEKPSLAKAVVEAINSMSNNTMEFNKNGFYENNEYYVSYAFGHLFTLKDIEEYDYVTESYWDYTKLPFYPNRYLFTLKKDSKDKSKVDQGVQKQYNVLNKLINSNNVTEIVNCGDADREGEIIVRTILREAKNNKKVTRLWLKDLTVGTISDALNNLIDDSIYDNLANEGYSRMIMDWDFGINLSRYATMKLRSTGIKYNVGRVLTTIVKEIYDRDINIENFKPQKYYQPELKGSKDNIEYKISSVKEFFKDDYTNPKESCDEYSHKLNSGNIVVENVEGKEIVAKRPKLFSQTTLQNFMSKKYNFKPNKTLQIAQSLYEKKLLSYPRTPTEYLTEAEMENVEKIIKVINNREHSNLILRKTKDIFDETKVESHSAIIPTCEYSDDLTDDERKVYLAVTNRFKVNFFNEDCIERKTIYTFNCSNVEKIKLSSTVNVVPAWKSLEPSGDGKELPCFIIGENIPFKFNSVEKTTKPANHYSVTTLNNFLKSPLKKDVNEDEEKENDVDYQALAKGIEIGTEATRSGIIEKAIALEYIKLDKSKYTITDKGKHYIQNLSALQIDVSTQNTIDMNILLKKVYTKEMTVMEFLSKSHTNIDQIIEIANHAVLANTKAIGKCKICGGDITIGMDGITCSNSECKFRIPVTLLGCSLSEKDLVNLYEGKETSQHDFVSKKTKKPFSAKLKYNYNEQKLEWVIENKMEEKNTTYKCPKCGHDLVENGFCVKCPTCDFLISKNICNTKITDKQINNLLTKGETDLIKGFVKKDGKKFNAKLTFDENKKLKFTR